MYSVRKFSFYPRVVVSQTKVLELSESDHTNVLKRIYTKVDIGTDRRFEHLGSKKIGFNWQT